MISEDNTENQLQTELSEGVDLSLTDSTSRLFVITLNVQHSLVSCDHFTQFIY
ncbi:hypothetical protein KSF78_0000665 [Schistosoma japonicum]|nr:hypothetical protein KSF78_0000665 [Schistosoma japonicum]